MLWTVALLACAPNTLRVRGDAPFALEKVVSSLWVGEAEADAWGNEGYLYGQGSLLMSSEELSCELLRQGNLSATNSVVWRATGLIAQLRFSGRSEGPAEVDDVGWEGTYWSAVDYETRSESIQVSRWMYSGIFADGTFLSMDYATGFATISEHSATMVKGRIETAMYVARFQAENCGEEDATDTGYYGDSGSWEAR